MYTVGEFEQIRKLARSAGLRAPDAFWDAPASELIKVCNGVGADWQSDKTRKILTKACACVEATACIHDFEYHNATLTSSGQGDADDLFLLNGIKETLYKTKRILSLKFIWDTRKVLTAYLVLRRVGGLAWAQSYFNKQLEGNEK